MFKLLFIIELQEQHLPKGQTCLLAQLAISNVSFNNHWTSMVNLSQLNLLFQNHWANLNQL